MSPSCARPGHAASSAPCAGRACPGKPALRTGGHRKGGFLTCLSSSSPCPGDARTMRGRCAADRRSAGHAKNRSDRRRQRSDRYHKGIFPEGEESGDEGGGTSAADMVSFYRIGKKSHVSKSFQRPQYFERIRSGRDTPEETVRLRRGEAAETLYNYLVLQYIYIFARVFLPLAADQEEGKAPFAFFTSHGYG